MNRRIGKRTGKVRMKAIMLLFMFSIFMVMNIRSYASENENQEEAEIEITISEPETEWVGNHFDVKVDVNVISGRNFEIKSIMAKAGAGARDKDITESKEIRVTDNGTLSVTVTDVNGSRYSKAFEITYFDLEGPELMGAVNDGVLHLQVSDDKSGVCSLIINGYEYTDCPEGELSVRLQQFDSSYEQFSIYATDMVGNYSEEYVIPNPYFQTEEDLKDDDMNYSALLPINAEHSAITSAVGTVVRHATEYGVANGTGKVLTASGNEVIGYDGMEFYTVETLSGKTFYMIIDKSRSDNNAYLLTEANENDLLHFTGTESMVLPQNGAVIVGSSLIGTDGEINQPKGNRKNMEEIEGEVTEKEMPGSTSKIIIIVVVAIVFGAVAFFVKKNKRKKEEESNQTPFVPYGAEDDVEDEVPDEE